MLGGVIIAGGRSTRFGEEDKAVATLAEKPLIRHVADRIEPTIDCLAINCREDQCSAIASAMSGYSLPIDYAIDEVPDLGPVAGIAEGMRALPEEVTHTFVAACDMPFIDTRIVAYLYDQREGYDAVVPRLDNGWFQPTHAIYHIDRMTHACDAALEDEQFRLLSPLESLAVREVSQEELQEIGDLSSFENVNTRSEFEAANRKLQSDA